MTENFRFRQKLAFTVFCALLAGAAQAGNYVLEIDGKALELDLDAPANIDLGGGKQASVVLRQKAEQIWRSDGMSFEHPIAVKPSRRKISDSATQVIMATASGTIVLVQRYTKVNPEQVIDLMISELTDDEVTAGYKRTIESATRKLADGTALSGKQVHVERGKEYADYEILTTNRRGGYLIVHRVSDYSPKFDRQLVKQFWQTLQLNVTP